MGQRILITGATGYIGRRLKDRLLDNPDRTIRLLVRNRSKVRPEVLDRVEIVEGDTFQEEALAQALSGVDIACYLIHSMGARADFERLDRTSAENFRDAAIAAGVRRIIYLGGLGVKKTASKHLLSRSDRIQTIWFRAGVIIGSGSASFEIIRNLCQKLPLMITPKWVKTRTQPIAVQDVLAYLEAALTLPAQENLVIDIGCGALTFQEMMLQAAEVMGLRRFMLPVPVLSPRLSAYWLVLFTPVPLGMAAALVEGLRSETVLQNNHAARYFPEIIPMGYQAAVRQAISEIVNEQVISRWCDSGAGAVCDIKGQDDIANAVLRDCRSLSFGTIPPEKIFASACAVGGTQGWFTYNVLWRLRGLIDKLAGGYGLNRGRRSSRELRVGDAIDFWKVADIRAGKRLLLLAQMKLPGRAWLEFSIQGTNLIQTAHFYPKGIWGRLYWYAVAPLHHLVFKNLLHKIVERAAQAP